MQKDTISVKVEDFREIAEKARMGEGDMLIKHNHRAAQRQLATIYHKIYQILG